MNAGTQATSLAGLIAVSLTLTAWAAEPPKPEAPADLDKLVGQPVDLSPWAYAWRADPEVQEQPEACFIPRRLKRLDTVYRPFASRLTEEERAKRDNQVWVGFPPAPTGGLQSALLWLAPVPTERIELRWPEGSAIPPAEAIEVRVYPAKVGWFGLVRDEVLPAPQVSSGGRTWSYINEIKDPVTRRPKGMEQGQGNHRPEGPDRHGDRDGPVLTRNEHAGQHCSPRHGAGAWKPHEHQPPTTKGPACHKTLHPHPHRIARVISRRSGGSCRRIA